MVLTYNKYKKGRVLSRGSSPRDLQNRATSRGSYEALLQKIAYLEDELKKAQQAGQSGQPVVSGYTEKEFNEALEKALLKEIKSLERKHKEVLDLKEDSIRMMQTTLDSKDRLITTLHEALEMRGRVDKLHEGSASSSDRPSIKEEVIDPTEDSDMESHIDVPTTKSEVNMSDKLSKLKDALGRGI